MISPKSISVLADKIDLLVVAEKYARGELRKTGSTYVCLSPFTNEKTPSCHFNVEKGFFKDFSSGNGGDAIEFIKLIEGVGYIDALRILASMFDVKLEEDGKQESFTTEGARAMTKEFSNALKENKSAMDYAVDRFTKEGVKHFALGLYVPDIMMDLKVRMGITSDSGKEYMYGRLTFPVRSRSGRVISYFARTLTGAKPKYISGHNTDYYKKSETLYGVFENAAAIRKADKGYLVEGQPDVISMYLHGYPALAGMGTELTEKQMDTCLRLTLNWVILFDGDRAGKSAAIKTVSKFARRGIELNVAALTGVDPDEYLKVNKKLDVPERKGFDYLIDEIGQVESADVMMEYLSAIRKTNPFCASFVHADLVERFDLNKNVNNIEWAEHPLKPQECFVAKGVAERWKTHQNEK